MSRRPRHTAAETRHAIFEAASVLFDTVGYSNTSMADIAAQAGMSSANVYKHFPNKAAIIHFIAEHHFQEIERDLGPLDMARPVEEQILADVLHLVRGLSLDGTPQILDVLASTVFDEPPVLRSFRGRLAARFAAVFAAGVARGELAPGDPVASAHTVVEALVALIDPLLLVRRLTVDPGFDAEGLARRLVKLLVAGLKHLP